jgi:hypothetical protein
VQIRIHNSDQLLCWCVISLPVTLYLWWHCFLGKLFPVLIGMQRLKQHWAQYRNNQRKLIMSLFISLAPKISKTRKENHLFHKKYFFVKQMVLLKKKTGLHQLFATKYSAIWTVFVAALYASYLQQSTYLGVFFDFRHDEFPTKNSVFPFGIKWHW